MSSSVLIMRQFCWHFHGFCGKFNAENQLPPKDLNDDEKIIEFCIECSKIRMEYPGLCTARFEARQMQAKQNVPNER